MGRFNCFLRSLSFLTNILKNNAIELSRKEKRKKSSQFFHNSQSANRRDHHRDSFEFHFSLDSCQNRALSSPYCVSLPRLFGSAVAAEKFQFMQAFDASAVGGLSAA